MNYRKTALWLMAIAVIEFAVILGLICGIAICFCNMAIEAKAAAPISYSTPPKPFAHKEVCLEPTEPVEVIEEPEIPKESEPTAPISDDVPLSWELQQVVVDICEEYDLKPELVLGIMDVESDFRETADNGKCYGLMQIHRGNQKWVREGAGVTDIFDSTQNIRAGCWILSEGIALCDTLEQALVWYNAGKVYADSTTYSREVLKETEKWGAIIYAS